MILLAWLEGFEHRNFSFKTTSDSIVASKALILEQNEVYKLKKDLEIMDQMKRLTTVKQKLRSAWKEELNSKWIKF